MINDIYSTACVVILLQNTKVYYVAYRSSFLLRKCLFLYWKERFSFEFYCVSSVIIKSENIESLERYKV